MFSIPPFILPVGDSAKLHRAPVATWALIAVHLLVFFSANLPVMSGSPKMDGALAAEWRERVRPERTSQELAEREAMSVEERRLDDVVQDLLSPRQKPDPDILRVFGGGYRAGSASFYKLFTSLFLHAGLLATGFHLLLLWILGDNIEHHIGRLPFLALYGGGGALGGLLGTHLPLIGSTLPVLSSTSALGALIGAYFMFFRYSEIHVIYVGGIAWRAPTAGSLYIKARIILPAFAAMASLMGHMNRGARGATWIGVVIGCVAALLLRSAFGPGKQLDPNKWYPDPLNVTTDPVQRIHALLSKNRDREAAQIYLENRDRPDFKLHGPSKARVAQYLEEHGMTHLAAAARSIDGRVEGPNRRCD